MLEPLLLVIGILALVITATARPGHARRRMGFPAVLPPLVEVQPGVCVVQDFDEEVFFILDDYWVQRDGDWYRARDHRGAWRFVSPGRVPTALVRHEPGRFRHWQPDEHGDGRARALG
jgi:hypothetical protein